MHSRSMPTKSLATPPTPSEVHWRVYHRVIEPLKDVSTCDIVDECSSKLLADLLRPIELTTYPPTFGPDDDDPFCALTTVAKTISPQLWLDTYSGDEGRDAIRIAYMAMKETKAAAMQPRFALSADNVAPSSSRPFFPILTARAIQEGKEAGNTFDVAAGPTDIFLPRSKHFIMSFINVEAIDAPETTVEEVSNLAWWHGRPGELKSQVCAAIRHAVPPPSTIERTWERWDKLSAEPGGRFETMDPPLFPISANLPTYYHPSQRDLEDAVSRVREPSVTPNQFIAATLDAEEGAGAYDLNLLEDFDGPSFEPISSSTRCSDSASTRHQYVAPADEDIERLVPWMHSDASLVQHTPSPPVSPEWKSRPARGYLSEPTRQQPHVRLSPPGSMPAQWDDRDYYLGDRYHHYLDQFTDYDNYAMDYSSDQPWRQTPQGGADREVRLYRHEDNGHQDGALCRDQLDCFEANQGHVCYAKGRPAESFHLWSDREQDCIANELQAHDHTTYDNGQQPAPPVTSSWQQPHSHLQPEVALPCSHVQLARPWEASKFANFDEARFSDDMIDDLDFELEIFGADIAGMYARAASRAADREVDDLL